MFAKSDNAQDNWLGQRKSLNSRGGMNKQRAKFEKPEDDKNKEPPKKKMNRTIFLKLQALKDAAAEVE